MGAPRVYTAEQAAELLQCKASWLRRAAADRRIPVRLISGSYRWTDTDLAALLDQQLRPAATAPRPARSEPRQRTRNAHTPQPTVPDAAVRQALRPRRTTSATR